MLSRLGCPEEKVVKLTDSKLSDLKQASKSLKPLALGITYKKPPSDISYFQGQDDDAFKTDGNITKKDIRALTLSELKSFGSEVLWDIGAGSGSISIEWCLGHPKNVAFAIERRRDRISLIKANRKKFGLQERLTVKHGNIETIAKDLPTPNAVFIGGGVTSDLIYQVIKALNKNSRLVINAVTLESQALLLKKYKQFGGNLKKINISKPKPIGGKTIWSAQYNIIQWSFKT
jgi:precorrin-6Y C5,15-methyltransferase (decarboxylating)